MLFTINFEPENDGIDHINIYSKGKTELGRLLSNFAHTPFCVQAFGTFQSIEGYWYWLGTNDDALKTMYGFEAKRYGSKRPVVYTYPEGMFRKFIIDALTAKLEQTEGLKEKLRESNLPFDHYYVGKKGKIPAGFEWITEFWEEKRGKLNETL